MSQILEIRSKSIEDAIAKALRQLSVSREDIEVEVIENPVKGFLGLIGNKEGKYRITLIEKEEPKVEKELTEADVAREFVENIINNLKIDAKVDVTQEKNVIKVNIIGKDAACLIGRRGETLDSIQFLAGLALNKVNKDSHSRVLIDIENYRSKKEKSL